MNDRLAELTGGNGGGGGSSAAPFEIAIDINDTGDGGSGGSSGASFMEGFFDKVNAVKKDIDAVKKVRGACHGGTLHGGDDNAVGRKQKWFQDGALELLGFSFFDPPSER